MTTDCLFCRIVAGEIPADVVHETDDIFAFRDIHPKAPTHVLVIPKAHVETFAALGKSDPALAGKLAAVCGQVAEQEKIAEAGYRVLFNTGPHAGQEVFHVHAHVLGGRALGPMLASARYDVNTHA